MALGSNTPKERVTVRLIIRDKETAIQQIYEQEIPASEHQARLLLRRQLFGSAVADALLRGWTAEFERKK